jgi:hypothetical protein
MDDPVAICHECLSFGTPLMHLHAMAAMNLGQVQPTSVEVGCKGTSEFWSCKRLVRRSH